MKFVSLHLQLHRFKTLNILRWPRGLQMMRFGFGMKKRRCSTGRRAWRACSATPPRTQKHTSVSGRKNAGHVATITMDRASAHNALNPALCSDLRDAWLRFRTATIVWRYSHLRKSIFFGRR